MEKVLSNNISTAILCKCPAWNNIYSLGFLFEVALKFAENGLVPYILTKSELVDGVDTQFSNLNINPLILERIYFRYFQTAKDVVTWCHNVQDLSIKPEVFLVNINDFCDIEDFNSLILSSALIDAALYLSKIKKQKHIYLLVIVNLKVIWEKQPNISAIFPSLSVFSNVWCVSGLSSFTFRHYKNENAFVLKEGNVLISESDICKIFQRSYI